MAGLGDYPAGAVLRAEDLDRAVRFYTETLGLTEEGRHEAGAEAVLRAGNGSQITLYERPGMAAPLNTTLGFGVPPDQLEQVMADLRSRGVRFEDYDIPEIGLKTVSGVADMDGMKAAWFKDSEGNILSLGTM